MSSRTKKSVRREEVNDEIDNEVNDKIYNEIDDGVNEEWVRSANDHQFWAFQYGEHAEMVALILSSLGPEWNNFREMAVKFQK